MPKDSTTRPDTGATRELTQRDRLLLAWFMEHAAEQLHKDGKATRVGMWRVASALRLDADGIWPEMAATQAAAADRMSAGGVCDECQDVGSWACSVHAVDIAEYKEFAAKRREGGGS